MGGGLVHCTLILAIVFLTVCNINIKVVPINYYLLLIWCFAAYLAVSKTIRLIDFSYNITKSHIYTISFIINLHILNLRFIKKNTDFKPPLE